MGENSENATEIYISEIVKETAINGLCKPEYPVLSIETVLEEPRHSRGIRKIITKNFYIYYWANEHIKRVYNKRDQLQALKNIAD